MRPAKTTISSGVSTPTIMPEPARATAMVAAENEASVRASQHRQGVIHVFRSRKDSATGEKLRILFKGLWRRIKG